MNMALGKRCGNSLRSKRGGVVGEEGLGLGFVRYTRGLGRKRVLISNNLEASPMDSAPKTPTKRRYSEGVVLEAERSPLEALTQDILVSTKFLSFNLCIFSRFEEFVAEIFGF
jgi:hypothetical protein